MRILHVYKSYFPESFGGVENAIQNISQATHSLGCENHLLTVTRESKFKQKMIKDLEVTYFPSTINFSSCPMSVQLFRNFKSLVKNIDIIHYHFPWPFADLIHHANRINKPYLITYHSDIVRQKYLKYFYKPLMTRFLKHANVIVPTSKNLMNSSVNLKKFEDKCHPIPLCINPDDYQEKDKKYAKFIQTKYGNEFILFIGVLRYYKGLHYLLKAYKEIKMPLLIAGDGPEKKNLLSLSKDLKLKNVFFLGEVNDVQKNTLLELCQAVALPSHLPSEAFGVSLLEGLLFGKPLISTELGTGTSFTNQHLKTGLVVPPGNVEALREALNRISEDQLSLENWRRDAKLHFDKTFALKKIGEEYVQLYRHLT